MAAKARAQRSIVRRSYREIFLQKLGESSENSPKLVNNKTLRNALGWAEERYQRIKEELVAENAIVATRGGPGGAVSLLTGVPNAAVPSALNLFISYSHSDEAVKNELVKHLSPLKRQRLVAHWHDREILAGESWRSTISKNLVEADIVILLISIDFINSEYCYSIEMEDAPERAATGRAVVIPVIARSCMWKSSPFASLQALPTDGKAISTWQDRDEALTIVSEGIRLVAERS
jgi:hypothetical protein